MGFTIDEAYAKLSTKYGAGNLGDLLNKFNSLRGFDTTGASHGWYGTGLTVPAGDLDIRVRVTLNDWSPATTARLVQGDNLVAAPNYTFYSDVQPTGVLQAYWSFNGTALWGPLSTVATGFADGSTAWLRYVLDVDNGAGGKDTKFYTSTTDTNDPGAPAWTQLGATVTQAGTATAVNPGNGTPVTLGSALSVVGRTHVVQFRSGASNAPYMTLDATSLPRTGTITDAQGRVWTNYTGGNRRLRLGRNLRQGNTDFYAEELARLSLAPSTNYTLDRANQFWSAVTAAGL